MTQNEMTQYEMTEKLAARMGSSLGEAREALEESGWDMLEAAVLLEQRKATQAETVSAAAREEDQAVSSAAGGREAGEANAEPCDRNTRRGERKENWRSTMKNIGKAVRNIIDAGNRNHFEIRRKEALVLSLPVTVMVLLLLVAFWVCVPLLVVGLFTGFRYSFSGSDLGREDINRALDRAADTAENVKQDIRGHEEGSAESAM